MKTLIERKVEFERKVFRFDEYSNHMLLQFADYWTEHNERGQKMRFEKQKTWNLSLRLKRWARNDKKWNRTPTKLVNESVNQKLEKYG